MTIAITLVHNKDALANVAQITWFLALTTIHYDEGLGRYYYTFNGVLEEHMVLVYQIVPYGVKPPSNLNDLDSHKVFYGKGDEDKTGNHPRFFNWGLKRGIDQGCEISIYLSDITSLSPVVLWNDLKKVADTNDSLEFMDGQYGQIASGRALHEIGQFKETKTLSQAVTDYKDRITAKGYSNG